MASQARIRPARPGDATRLSDLAMRSKAHWGYDTEFMESCRSELLVTEDNIQSEAFDYAIAIENDSIIGFYAIKMISAGCFELEALFVEPDSIGLGVGRLLVQHAIQNVADRQGRTLTIQGDPNATAFYAAAGARQVGTRESGSIPGRVLPLFEIRIAP